MVIDPQHLGMDNAKVLGMNYHKRKSTTREEQWKSSNDNEGMIPLNVDQLLGSGSKKQKLLDLLIPMGIK